MSQTITETSTETYEKSCAALQTDYDANEDALYTDYEAKRVTWLYIQ